MIGFPVLAYRGCLIHSTEASGASAQVITSRLPTNMELSGHRPQKQ